MSSPSQPHQAPTAQTIPPPLHPDDDQLLNRINDILQSFELDPQKREESTLISLEETVLQILPDSPRPHIENRLKATHERLLILGRRRSEFLFLRLVARFQDLLLFPTWAYPLNFPHIPAHFTADSYFSLFPPGYISAGHAPIMIIYADCLNLLQIGARILNCPFDKSEGWTGSWRIRGKRTSDGRRHISCACCLRSHPATMMAYPVPLSPRTYVIFATPNGLFHRAPKKEAYDVDHRPLKIQQRKLDERQHHVLQLYDVKYPGATVMERKAFLSTHFTFISQHTTIPENPTRPYPTPVPVPNAAGHMVDQGPPRPTPPPESYEETKVADNVIHPSPPHTPEFPTPHLNRETHSVGEVITIPDSPHQTPPRGMTPRTPERRLRRLERKLVEMSKKKTPPMAGDLRTPPREAVLEEHVEAEVVPLSQRFTQCDPLHPSGISTSSPEEALKCLTAPLKKKHKNSIRKFLSPSSHETTNDGDNHADNILHSYFGYPVSVKNFNSVSKKGAWVDDTIINVIFSFFNWECVKIYIANRRSPPVFFYTTEFFKMLIDDRKRDFSGYHDAQVCFTEKVRKWQKSSLRLKSVLECRMIIVPIHASENHWLLGVINFEEKSIAIYDSMRMEYGDRLAELLFDYVWNVHQAENANEFPSKEEWDLFCAHNRGILVPQQQNAHDCGVFTIYTAAFIYRNLELVFKQSDIPHLRKRISYCIATYRLLM